MEQQPPAQAQQPTSQVNVPARPPSPVPPPLPPPPPQAPDIVQRRPPPPPPWQWVTALGALCIAVGVGVGFMFLQSLPAPPVYGRLVKTTIEETNKLGETLKREQLVAFLHCHLIGGPPEAEQWLQGQRERNQDSSRLDAKALAKRDAQCMSPFADPSSYVFYDSDRLSTHFDADMARRIKEAIANTPNLTTRLQPQATSVFVDSRGFVYYRVLVPSFFTAAVAASAAAAAATGTTTTTSGSGRSTGLVPVLVSHINLLYVLEEWTARAVGRIGAAIHPCICPAHLGMIASGLHFTADSRVCAARQTIDATHWSIWLDFHRAHVTTSLGKMPARQEFFPAWDPFPADIDAALWPRAPEDMMQIDVAMHYEGIDGGAFHDAAVLAGYGETAADYSRSAVRSSSSSAERVPFNGQDEEYLLRISERRIPRTACRPTSEQTFAFSKCARYCEALERHLLSTQNVTR